MHIQDVHEDIKIWKNRVKEVKEEVAELRKQLEEVAARSLKEDMAYVQEYESRFIRQDEVCDVLFHDLKQLDRSMLDYAAGKTVVLQEVLKGPEDMRERVATFEKLYAELKDGFFEFAS
jgi:hypothetical protein